MTEIKELETPIQVNQVYRHFKGRNYVVVDLAIDSETMELRVVYQPLYKDPLALPHDRLLSMWKEEVNKPEYNFIGKRFTHLEDETELSDDDKDCLSKIRMRRCLKHA